MAGLNDRRRWACLAGLALLLVLAGSGIVHAQELEPINNTLDFLVQFMQGRFARLAGILTLGGAVLAFAFGRLEPSRLALVVITLAAFFGAPRIVDTILEVSRR